MDDETNVIQTSFDKDTHELTDEPEERGAGTFDMKDHEVRALGHNENHFFYYSSEKAMVVSLSAKSHGALDLLGMANELYWATRCGFSMAGAKPDKIPWQKLADSMMSQCRKVGFFSADNIRGRGAWFDRGRSFFHVGDRLIIDGTEVHLSDVDSKYIYTRRKQMRDFDLSERLSDPESRKIVNLSRRFRWHSPLHGNLLAGWIGHASICGASDWRAHVWLTGPTMSGKSTIATGFLHPLLGSDSSEFFQSAETTEAGIRQHMGCDSVPVIFDEFEADNRAVHAKVERVLSLMRQASSETAGKIIKGTALGEANYYTMRSAFCMVSIGVGIKHQADRNRVTILTLRGTKNDPEKRRESNEHWRELSRDLSMTLTPEFCRAFRARMIHLIPVFRNTQTKFASHIKAIFGDARTADQLSTLLAGYWLLTSSRAITDEQADHMVKHYQKGLEELQQESGLESEEERVYDRIISEIIPVEGDDGRSYRRQISDLMLRVAGVEDDPWVSVAQADATLRRYGMRVGSSDENGEKVHRLLVANDTQITKILEGTPWAEGWRRQLQRLDGAKSSVKTRFTNQTNGSRWCISLPFPKWVIGSGDEEIGTIPGFE